jgi:glycopeptide antibiotics resistance protein
METDYLDPRELERPSTFVAGFQRPSLYPPDGLLRDGRSRRDMVLNFVCFIPVGFVLGMLRGERGSLAFAVTVCAVASLSVEVTQFFFDQRTPSFSDWGLNVAGAVVGAWLARRLVVRVCGSAARRPAFLGIRSP